MKLVMIYKFKDGSIAALPPHDLSVYAPDDKTDWLTLTANKKLDNRPFVYPGMTKNGSDLVSVEVVFMENDDPELQQVLDESLKK